MDATWTQLFGQTAAAMLRNKMSYQGALFPGCKVHVCLPNLIDGLEGKSTPKRRGTPRPKKKGKRSAGDAALFEPNDRSGRWLPHFSLSQ